jgi:hypothetical protein
MSRTSPYVIASLAVVLASLSFSVPATAPAQAAPALSEFSSQQGFDPRFKARTPNVAPRNVAPRNLAPRNLQIQRGPAVQFRQPNVVPRGPGFRGPAVVGPGPGPGFRGPGFRGPIGMVPFHGARANFIRGPHRFFRNGRYIPFVAIGALGALAIGSRYYQPYAYVDGPGPDACFGQTDDGLCELRMTEVPLEDGSSVMQCVSYCPQD